MRTCKVSTDREQRDQTAVDQIRKVLAEGFAYVRGAEVRGGIATLTFDEMLARSIQEIDTDETDIRISKLSAVRSVRQGVRDAVEQTRRMPPEMFKLNNASESTNTNEDGSEPDSEA
jgi:hypothetical protein